MVEWELDLGSGEIRPVLYYVLLAKPVTPAEGEDYDHVIVESAYPPTIVSADPLTKKSLVYETLELARSAARRYGKHTEKLIRRKQASGTFPDTNPKDIEALNAWLATKNELVERRNMIAALTHNNGYDAILVPDGSWMQVGPEQFKDFLAAENGRDFFGNWHGTDGNWSDDYSTIAAAIETGFGGELVAYYTAAGRLVVVDAERMDERKVVYHIRNENELAKGV